MSARNAPRALRELSASARHLASLIEDITSGYSVTVEFAADLERLSDAVQEHISRIEDAGSALPANGGAK